MDTLTFKQIAFRAPNLEFIFTFTLAILFSPLAMLAQKSNPNILFILVDDLGWRDLGCYGSSFYETPNIDKLCAEGIKFANAYSDCPVCSPSRASFLTGKSPAHLRFTGHITSIGRHRWPVHGRIIPPDDKFHVDLNEIMLPEALYSLGYVTASIGKWHVGDEEKYFPTHQGFDINIAGYAQGSPPTYWAPYKNPKLTWNSQIENICEEIPGEYLTDRLTTEAIHFIEDHKERQFFIYLSHYAVHTPLMAPDSIVQKFKKKMESDHTQKSAVYAAMIESVDNGVGRILSKLDSLRIADNTIIILCGDNGGESEATSNAPLREGKGFLYEGGIRIPMIIKWPGHIKAGTTCDEPVIGSDLYPTIMQMIGKGVRPAKDIDGKSLLPLLLGKKKNLHSELCWFYPQYSPQAQMPGGAIRKGDYKLIEFYDPQKIELYNLKNDLGEKYDLSKEEPDKVEELKKYFNKWLKKMNPIMYTLNPNYQKDYRENSE